VIGVPLQVHENVRGKDVYLIQPTCPPVNENLMELLLMVRVAAAGRARRTLASHYPSHARSAPRVRTGLHDAPRVREPHHVRHPLLRLRAPGALLLRLLPPLLLPARARWGIN
jgi:hypothetical protein